MRLTPLDVRKQEFRKGMRGLDADEVYAFLATVADEYEAVLNDNKALRERLLELDDKVQEYRNMEKTLRDTLLTAERVTVEAKDSARREAELIIKEAQLDAEKGVREVKETAQRLRQEIQSLKQQRDSYLSRMKAVVESHLRFIDAAENDLADEERELGAQLKKWSNEKASRSSDADVFDDPASRSATSAESFTKPAAPKRPASVYHEALGRESDGVERRRAPEPERRDEAPGARGPVMTAPTSAPITGEFAAADKAAVATEEDQPKPSLKDLLDRVIDSHASDGAGDPAPAADLDEELDLDGMADPVHDANATGEDKKWSLSRLKEDILARSRSDEADRSDD